MASLWDTLFQGSPPPSVTTTATSQQGFPDWYQEIMRANMGQAAMAAMEPYIPYTGPRVAEQTSDQKRANSLVRGNVGAGRDAIQGGLDLANKVGGGFNEDEFSKYLSPYTEGVVDRIADLGARNLNEKLLPGVNDTFTGAGQFGSSRHAEFTNRALRDTQEAILGAQAGALEDAQNAAMGAYQRGGDQALTASTQLGGLGQLQQEMGLRDASALSAVGESLQGQEQKNLDVAYQDFIDQRDLPMQRAAWLSGIVNGTNPGTTSTVTGNGPASSYTPSLASQLGGLYYLSQMK